MRSRTRWVARGGAHSSMGQTITEEGIVLSAYPQAVDINLDNDGVVRLPAGADLWLADRMLREHGRQIPVIPQVPGVSVGGVASVGGISVNSVQHGAMVDWVTRLHLVDNNANPVRCSPTARPGRFFGALCGMGAEGFIWEVEIQTTPLPVSTVVYRLPRLTGANLADFVQRFVIDPQARPHAISGGEIAPWNEADGIEIGYHRYRANEPVPPPPGPEWQMSEVADYREQQLVVPEEGTFFFLPSTLLMPVDRIDAMWALLIRARAETVLGSVPSSIVPEFVRSTGNRRHWPHHVAGDWAIGFSILAIVRDNDPVLAWEVGRVLQGLSQAAAHLGGRPYRSGWHDPDVYRSV